MKPDYDTNLPDRFWSKVDEPNENECWLWTGYCDRDGYGRYGRGKTSIVHRMVALEVAGLTQSDLLALHHCDNPPCVNRKHLYLGTAQNNVDDMIDRGGFDSARGEFHYRTKLNKTKVLEIRRLHETGEHQQKELARRYKVTPSCIYSIVRRRAWKDV